MDAEGHEGSGDIPVAVSKLLRSSISMDGSAPAAAGSMGDSNVSPPVFLQVWCWMGEDKDGAAGGAAMESVNRGLLPVLSLRLS
jgi:hypothetical protein